MEMMRRTERDLSHDLIDAIQVLPLSRKVAHCGQTFAVSPFDIYANCPQCGANIKVRSFSGLVEIEDVFDAVFVWMNQPGAEAVVRERRKVIAEDGE
jgi:hypothetical protein